MNSSREYGAESSSSFLADMRGSPEHDVLRSTNNGAHSSHFSGRSTQINIETKPSQPPYDTQSPAGNTQPNNDDIGSRSTEVFYPEHTPVRPRRWFAKIHEALSNGKIGDIRYFLSFGITPLDDSFRYTGYFGNMLLRNLVRCKQSQPLDIILQWFKEHDLDCEKLQLDSLDELARQTDDQSVLDVLIHHGADKNKLMQTLDPLYKAAYEQDLCRVLELINQEEDINGKYKFYMLTPLYVALESRNVEIIELFLEVFVESHNINLFPALMYAAKNQDKNLFTRVLCLHNFSDTTNDDFLLILRNTIENVIDITLELLKKSSHHIDHILKHSNTDTEKKQLLNLLYLIFNTQNPELILWLIDRLQPQKNQLRYELSPVTIAASIAWKETTFALSILQILKIKGFSIEATPRKGKQCPLYMATRANNIDLTRWLLEKGVNPDAHSTGDHCPIHIAAELNYIDQVKLLLKYGADAEAGTSERPYSVEYCMNPLEIAVAQENEEMINILLGNNNTPDPLFYFAAAEGRHQLANWLIERSYLPTQTDKFYHSALSSDPQLMMKKPSEVIGVPDEQVAFELLFYIALNAALARQPQHRTKFLTTALTFLERIPHITCSSSGKRSALFRVADEGLTSVLGKLLERHADPNAFSSGENTPLFAAANKGHVKGVMMLIASGGLEAACQGKTSPLYAALKGGHIHTAAELMACGVSFDPNEKMVENPEEQQRVNCTMKTLEEKLGRQLYDNPLPLRSLVFRLVHEQLTPPHKSNPSSETIDLLGKLLSSQKVLNVIKDRYDKDSWPLYV